MNSDGADQSSQGSEEIPVEAKHESRKLPKFSYTREFLLSLSELDACKKLPVGFNVQVLSEFEGALNSTLEQQRGLGGFSLQSSKRNDYGSASSNRVDGANDYSRGSQGRWDTRFTGSSDKDSEVQSDHESFTQDSGRRYVNQSRRFSQNPEHDGLLGSGAFPRPSGYTGGASTTKGRGNDHYELNRSAEPYQPPRPYKAVPYLRKYSTDLCNDETFGSSECSSQDKAEEERKRRESFELMRKEQQKALQEKQKQMPNKHKENFDKDIMTLLENSEDDKGLNDKSNNKLENNVAPLVSTSDSSRGSFHLQAPASRPLVPPGFSSSIAEKNLSTQSSSTALVSMVENAGTNDCSLLTKVTRVANSTESSLEKGNNLATQMHSEKLKVHTSNIAVSIMDVIGAPSRDLEVSDNSAGLEHSSYVTSGLLEDNDSNEKNFSRPKNNDTIGQDHSTSILDKLFGNALAKNAVGVPNFVEHQGARMDEKEWSSTPSQSSKFAHWFPEEEKRPAEDLTSKNLLSLIVSKDKTGSQLCAVSDDIPPVFPLENSGTANSLPSPPAASSTIGISEQYYPSDEPDTSSGVLTCEDLEQFILAGVKESSSSLAGPDRGSWNALDANSETQKAEVDDHASQHLLSLLQKGTTSKDNPSFSSTDVMDSSEKFGDVDINSSISVSIAGNASSGNSEMVQSTKSLTLEALFGSAFMKELHSAEAPVSAQRSSVGDSNNFPRPYGSSFPLADDGLFSSVSSAHGSNTSHEGNVPLIYTQEAKSQKLQTSWLGFEVSQTKGTKPVDTVGFDEGSVDIHLPEEESLIIVGDTVNPVISELLPDVSVTKTEEQLCSKTADEFGDKRAALAAILKHERTLVPGMDGPTSVRVPYDMIDAEHLYRHLHGQPSSAQFPHRQMNQVRPFFEHLDYHAHRNPQMNFDAHRNPQMNFDAHRNPQMKFIGPESVHQDPQHPFSANIVPHNPFQTPGGPRFDPTAHLSIVPPMPMPGNFPSHHHIHGFPRGVPLSHPINHLPAYVPEMNTMNSFHRQANHGGFGMGVPGAGVAGIGGGGGNHPESLERLIEMELRANSKQIQPAAASHIPGIYGPELDMGFRYR